MVPAAAVVGPAAAVVVPAPWEQEFLPVFPKKNSAAAFVVPAAAVVVPEGEHAGVMCPN